MKTNPEEEYRQKINPFLKLYFELDEECVSKCKTKRIDYILKCKESGALFGLEVKNTYRKRGNDIGAFALQASNYSKLFWNTKFSKEPVMLLIFIAPAISNYMKNIITESVEYIGNSFDPQEKYISFHSSTHEHSNMNGLLGSALNIGEIRKLNKNRFIFSYRNKIIWDNTKLTKIHKVNYDFYKSKF